MQNPVTESAILTEQTILDSLPVAIIIVDKQASVHYCNQQAKEIFQAKCPDLADLSKLSSAFSAQDFHQAINELNNKPSRPFKVKIHFDRCHVSGLYQLKMIPYSENKQFYLITLNALSSEPSQYALLKKNFKELKQFSRLSAMREISSSLADKLNQPLTAILSYTQAMQRLYLSKTSSEEISDAMERVVANAEHAGQIIRNIRAQLNTNTLKCQSASINQLIQESIHLTELDNHSSNIHLITHFEPFSTTLCVDCVQFKQVILSLLNNAIEALLESHTENPEIILSTQLSELHYEITIEDNGPGIPKEIQDNLFEPFFSTKENGIGIGLSMCHHIIELHKGSISILSGPNFDCNKTDCINMANKRSGTIATIRLPR